MKSRFLQPQPRTGPETVLHLKLYDGPNWVTAGPVYNVHDYSSRGHYGVLKATSHPVYPGVDLDGDSDYIEIADHADLTPILTPFSISAWVYMHDATSFRIATKGVYNTDGEWAFEVASTDKLYFQLFDESIDNCRIARYYDTVMTGYENQWIHLVGTYDGGITVAGIKIYLNSVRVDDTDKIGDVFVAVENLNSPVYIGRYSTFYANGLIDNVMMWKKELSAMDALNIYNITKWRYGR